MQLPQIQDGIHYKTSRFLKEVINEFKSNGIRTSIFIDPDEKMIKGQKVTGTDRIELYTEALCNQTTLKILRKQFYRM